MKQRSNIAGIPAVASGNKKADVQYTSAFHLIDL